jgi:transcription initiation factor IIE alpha subunit
MHWVYPVGHRLRSAGIGNILKAILQYLKTHGERTDTEIAEAVGLPLAKVRTQLTDLAAKREIMVCHSIRYEKGKQIEGMKCRLAGYIPPAAPGRKSKAQLKLS